MTFVNRRAGRGFAFGFLVLALGCSRNADDATDLPPPPPNAPANGGPPGFPGAGVSRPEGVLVNDARACRGYTLIAPLMSNDTFLIDTDGQVVRTWHCGCHPALGATLLENGHLLRVGELPSDKRPFNCSGVGGRVQEFDWNGELVWDFRYADARHVPHHDAIKLPNGNVLLVVCERIPTSETVAAGRRPNTFAGDYLLSDGVVEIKPTGRTTGEVVWEWRAWDHLVQEHDRTRSNFGSVADHPELIDVNFASSIVGALSAPGPDLAKLQALGYVGTSAGGSQAAPSDGDWTHLNAVAYNADLDQIAVTGLGFSEVWVIDHGTTRAEAAGHTGGKRGRGGDLLYRWGNPKAYRHGTSADARLTGPHSVHWIGAGLPGAGHLLVFNNGAPESEGRHSSVCEVVPPLDSTGRYAQKAKSAFGPDRPVWSYSGDKNPDFFSPIFSGAERLPNGDTRVCLGMDGTVLEVTTTGEVVWKYAIPTALSGEIAPGVSRHGTGSRMRPPAPAGVPDAGNSVFRAPWYAPDYPGLVGKNLASASVP